MNRNGLHYEWSIDGKKWNEIGPEFRFLGSDYGQWGVEKRMITPFMMKGEDGLWHCVWTLNEKDGRLAHAASEDLVNWKRQSYPLLMKEGNCLQSELTFDNSNKEYVLSWLTVSGIDTLVYYTTTKDFKTFESAKKSTFAIRLKPDMNINKVSWKDIERLQATTQISQYRNQHWNEQTKDDAVRFANLKPLNAKITIETGQCKQISDMLFGIFFEDINYAADGGLYAELVQNRDFEYNLDDARGRNDSWTSDMSWSLKGEGTFSIATEQPLHANNPHYAVVEVKKAGNVEFSNEGYDGIVLRKGEKYYVSLFSRQLTAKGGQLIVRMVDKNGTICGETKLSAPTSAWKKLSASFTAIADAEAANLVIIPQAAGTLAFDMISLFPQKTFKNRPNGLRADLAQVIADIHPRFVRFPGGCVAHGDGLNNMYRWKNTIGPLESRKPQSNLWGYHQTTGLGYFEYFQFCEDIGAEPLPVVPAGVPCQNSRNGGQQDGIPMCEMDDYVQEVLDLIEWANGDAKTTVWGKKRAEAGHPKPFNLKYIGIGNEDLITDVFEERFTILFNAVKEKHPEITVIGTVGPSFEGTDYEEGWKIATRLGVPIVDEHYYQTPGWFIHNQEYYDKYDRSKSKVYLGEYAAHLPGRPNNLETALAEALYLTSVERNGDVVSMSSYAPLLAKEGHTQWNPDLIYFNNNEVKPTVGYQVQKLFGQNSGDEYFPSEIKLSDESEEVRNRVATSVVRDSKTGDAIIKLVNILPVSVKSELMLDALVSSNATFEKTVLTGKPTDKNLLPRTEMMDPVSNLSYEMPEYSFTVIRILNKQIK